MTFEIVEGLSPQYLIRRINSIIAIEIMSALTSDPNALMYTILPKAIERILIELKKQLMEIFRFHGSVDHATYNRFVSESHYRDIITDFMSGVGDNIKILPKYLEISDMKGYLKSVILEESDKLKRSLIAENIIAGNWAREEYYDRTDPKGTNRYKFAIFMDNRTSRQCKEINRRQNISEGMPIEALKKLINEVAYKYEPNYVWRDWNPHWYCRSIITRVFA